MGGKNGDGDAGPEFLPGSVLLEDLNTLAADAEALGLRVVFALLEQACDLRGRCFPYLSPAGCGDRGERTSACGDAG